MPRKPRSADLEFDALQTVRLRSSEVAELQRLADELDVTRGTLARELLQEQINAIAVRGIARGERVDELQRDGFAVVDVADPRGPTS